MKTTLFIFVFFMLSFPARGQSPRIGVIDFYGLRGISEARVRQALQIKEGDAPPASDDEARRRLEMLPNVARASLDFVCCDAGKIILYVGIEEKGAPALRFRSAPRGAIRLPDDIVRAGDEFYKALDAAVLMGDPGEDSSQGHALNNDPGLRRVQDRFVGFAARDLKRLRKVLRESSDAKQRALAAQIIAYAADKRDVVNDLVYGIGDANGGVRNAAMRALALIAGSARNAPERRIKVPVEPFILMLNSVEWTDRNKSSLALMQLTEKRDLALLARLHEQALPSLLEMARWKHAGHALAPFIVLGRIGDISEDDIYKTWAKGDREALVKRVQSKLKKH